MSNRIFLSVIVLFFTLISGFGDAHGFVHAADIWQNERMIWSSFWKSALGFSVGIVAYWVNIRFLKQLGVTSAETQTLFWFGTTLVGVALLSRKFLKWQPIDQFVAVAVVIGILWILLRTSEK